MDDMVDSQITVEQKIGEKERGRRERVKKDIGQYEVKR